MKKIAIFSLSIALALGACKKVDFDDPRTLTNQEAFEKVKDLSLKLTNSAALTSFFTTTDLWGAHLGMMADQSTTTNRYLEFWDFAEEPRKRLNNSTSYGGYRVISNPSNSFYQANLDATLVVDAIESGKPVQDAQGNDRKNDALAVAYLIKGISQGYLGTIYDRGVIVDKANDDRKALPDSYKDMILNAMKHFDKAISLANANPNFKFDFLPNPGVNLDKTTFIRLANSLAARLLASIPRDNAEAKALGAAHWDKVLAYANAGLTTNFTIPGMGNYQGYYHNQYDWINYLLGDGAAYIPVDIKLAWLANPSHPKYYPTTAGTVLPPVQTSDERFYQYFGYDPDFGYLRPDRNRGIFSNYFRKRWDPQGNQDMSLAGTPNPFFLAEEIRLLKAEANLFKGNLAAAAALLNDPAARRKSVGKLPDVAATEAAIRHALHYEYSIEIDAAAGIAHPWAFMRRHDLLIGGTATQLPVPQNLTDLLKESTYSFGGKAFMGEKGKWGETGTAANVGWKASE